MATGMNTPGSSDLAAVFKDMITGAAGTPDLEFGKIESGKVLKANSFPYTSPKDDFYSCVRNLRVDDQVLITWIGSVPCVIGKVYSGPDATE